MVLRAQLRPNRHPTVAIPAQEGILHLLNLVNRVRRDGDGNDGNSGRASTCGTGQEGEGEEETVVLVSGEGMVGCE